MTWPECPFWDFSLALYAGSGVERACLELQRRHGLDVNLLLLACWLASQGVALDRAGCVRARKAVRTWQLEVVRPLRALRRRLAVRLDHAKAESLIGRQPAQVERLGKDILRIELDGEHLAQLALAEAAADLQPTGQPGPGLAVLNLAQIWRFTADDLGELRTLLQQTFPAATEDQLTTALRSIEG